MFRGAFLGFFSRMKKLCSNFLVVKRNYWTFGVNYLSNMGKLQPTCPAERLKFFSGGKIIVWAFSASERNYPAFGKKIHGTVAKSAFHVSSAKLWEKMTKLIYTTITFLGPWVSFARFWQKKVVRCVETVSQVYRRNTWIKILPNEWFFVFFGFLARKTCVCFYLKVFDRVVKTFFYVFRGTLQNIISERESWKFEDFWINFEVSRTIAENLFQGCQSSNRCPGEQFIEKSSSKEKNSLFFPILSDVFLSARNSPDLQNSHLRIRGSFRGKTFFENLYNLSHFFGLWSK